MKRRLSRAKAKIKATAIPFAVPADRLLPDRFAAVLAVVYLICCAAWAARKRRGRRSSTPCGWPRRTRSAVLRPPVGGL
jgi:predicted RNA polymerase sigma factor